MTTLPYPLERTTYRNQISSAPGRGRWRDPDFDPDQAAFYPALVFGIPTPRLSAYDAARLGAEHPQGVAATTRESVWISPI
jgi:Protein of unknown function (DUF3604)